jgi:septal ring factor EnvC (AmiA/AmiB activator)
MMSNLEKFRKTVAGQAIMSGAIFMAVMASPAVANLGAADIPAPALQQTVPPTETVRHSNTSTARLTEMLEASVEDLEAHAVDLTFEKTLSERHVDVLMVMDRLIDGVNDLFSAEMDELSPVEKIAIARRIVDNNIKLSRMKLNQAATSSQHAIEVSFSPEDEVARPAAYSQLAANRQQIMEAIEDTRGEIDYVVDEIAKSRDENAYYRESLQEVTNLFEKVLLAKDATQTSLEADFATLKKWQTEFREELATTDDTFSVSAR